MARCELERAPIAGGKKLGLTLAATTPDRPDRMNAMNVTLPFSLAAAMKKANAVDPKAVALALEGLEIDTPTGKAWMQKENHQIVQPLFISTFAEGVKFDLENTGFGFKTDARIEAQATVLPTTCRMQRPA